MPESALGGLVEGFAGRPRLESERGRAAQRVDHAYIYRLETGAKEAPSDEVINKLILALTPRDAMSKSFAFWPVIRILTRT